MVDVEWCVLAVFYCFETNTPLLSSCNLLIQLKQGQLASLFSIPFFLYSRNILEYSFFTARELYAFLLSSAVTQGSWVLLATSAPHPATFWAGADKKKPEQLKEEGYSCAIGGGRVAGSKRTVWTVTFLFAWKFLKLASDPTVNTVVAHMRLQGTCHNLVPWGTQPMRCRESQRFSCSRWDRDFRRAQLVLGKTSTSAAAESKTCTARRPQRIKEGLAEEKEGTS